MTLTRTISCTSCMFYTLQPFLEMEWNGREWKEGTPAYFPCCCQMCCAYLLRLQRLLLLLLLGRSGLWLWPNRRVGLEGGHSRLGSAVLCEMCVVHSTCVQRKATIVAG
jgi:hypothetical protein